MFGSSGAEMEFEVAEYAGKAPNYIFWGFVKLTVF